MTVPAAPYRAPQPLALPPRPPLAGLATATVVCALLAAYTTSKLDTMARLRGDVPGIAPRTMVLVGLRRRFSPHQAEYDLVATDDRARGAWTIQLTSTQMRDRRYGDALRVRCLDDDRACYLRDSVYVSDGNVQFDHGLRVIELAGLAVCLTVMARRIVRWRMLLRVLRPREGAG